MLFPSPVLKDTLNAQFIKSEEAITDVMIEIVKEGSEVERFRQNKMR